MTIFGCVCESYLAFCRKRRLKGAWRHLRVDVDSFTCPPVGLPALAQLTGEFWHCELIDSGIVRRDEAGLVLNELLDGKENRVIALRRAPGGLPFALMTSGG